MEQGIRIITSLAPSLATVFLNIVQSSAEEPLIRAATRAPTLAVADLPEAVEPINHNLRGAFGSQESGIPIIVDVETGKRMDAVIDNQAQIVAALAEHVGVSPETIGRMVSEGVDIIVDEHQSSNEIRSLNSMLAIIPPAEREEIRRSIGTMGDAIMMGTNDTPEDLVVNTRAMNTEFSTLFQEAMTPQATLATKAKETIASYIPESIKNLSNDTKTQIATLIITAVLTAALATPALVGRYRAKKAKKNELDKMKVNAVKALPRTLMGFKKGKRPTKGLEEFLGKEKKKKDIARDKIIDEELDAGIFLKIFEQFLPNGDPLTVEIKRKTAIGERLTQVEEKFLRDKLK